MRLDIRFPDVLRVQLIAPSTISTEQQTLNEIMSNISDFAAKFRGFMDRQEQAVAGIKSDVDAMNAKISQIQNSPGPISAEDQTSLDELTARGSALADRLEALDAQNASDPAPVLPPDVAAQS